MSPAVAAADRLTTEPRRAQAGARPWWPFAGRARRPTAERIRITRVGLWYVLLTLIIGLAATNTGNNALYLVLSLMLGLLVVSGFLSRTNVRGLGVSIEAPAEIHARRPFELSFTLTNQGWLVPRYLLLVTLGRSVAPRLIAELRRDAPSRGRFELLLTRRGRHRISSLHVASLFPLGLFQKGMRYPVDLDLLVFPELFPAATRIPERRVPGGEGRRRRAGWGHDLHALRPFRRGDDPRGIHWKQTARTGRMIYLEREAEEGRRLSIVLDNRSDELDQSTRDRFEHLVSEAATSAVDHLRRGFEVELVTRGRTVPFGGGEPQKLRLLEALALVEPTAEASELRAVAGSAELRLVLEPEASR